MSLYQKYRPKKFKDIVGNPYLITMLMGELKKPEEERSRVYLFQGPTGSGKTTFARIMAHKLGATGFDLVEMDFGAFRGIDQVRELKENSAYAPISGKSRVWIIDELQNATVVTQQALLKVLEDTPASTYIIICTTDPEKLIKALLGRCKQYSVAPLHMDETVQLLHRIADAEGYTIGSEIFESIHEATNGLPRNSIQLLEQIMTLPPEDYEKVIKAYTTVGETGKRLGYILMDEKVSWKGIAAVLSELRAEGAEPEGLRRQVLGYMTAVLLGTSPKPVKDIAAGVMECFEANTYNTGFAGIVLAAYRVFSMR